MSEVRKCETCISDVEVLREALGVCGIKDEFLKTGEGLTVNDGRVDHSVDILIPRAQAKTRGDIGFKKEADGRYTAVVRGDDYAGLADIVKNGRLTQCYAKAKILKVIEEQMSRGEIVRDVQAGGKIRMRVKIPEY